ncbi:MAG: outer membrane beta-barrel protein [Rhodothermales bacterium]
MSIARITTLLLLACAAWPVQAQDGARFGLKLGATSAELRFSNGTNGGGLESRFGLNAGVFAAVPVRGAWRALVAADYYRKGYEAGEFRDENNTRRFTDADFQYDYASLLIAPQYAATLGSGGLRFYAFLGPRLDLLAAERVVATVDGERETVELPFDTPGFESIVFGVSAGIGLDLADAVSMPLLIELRYDADVTPARSLRNGDSRFRTFSLRAGLSF